MEVPPPGAADGAPSHAHAVPSWSVLRYAVVLSIENLVVYGVSGSVAVGKFDAMQSIQNCSQTLAIIQLHKAFDILQNEVFWTICVNVLVDLPEDFSSAFVVVEALLFTSLTEGLAWKTSAVYIHVPSEMMSINKRVFVLDVFEQLLRLPVAFDRSSRYRVDLATEFVRIVSLQVVKSLERCLNS